MTEETLKELREIEDICKRQLLGNYTTQADAIVALGMIQRLCKALADNPVEK